MLLIPKSIFYTHIHSCMHARLHMYTWHEHKYTHVRHYIHFFKSIILYYPYNTEREKKRCFILFSFHVSVNGQETIIRSCEYNHENACLPSSGHSSMKEVFCETCTVDGCNGAHRLTSATLTALLPSVLWMLAAKFLWVSPYYNWKLRNYYEIWIL
jgi:hypothetical protein